MRHLTSERPTDRLWLKVNRVIITASAPIDRCNINLSILNNILIEFHFPFLLFLWFFVVIQKFRVKFTATFVCVAREKSSINLSVKTP